MMYRFALSDYTFPPKLGCTVVPRYVHERFRSDIFRLLPLDAENLSSERRQSDL